MRNVTLVLAVVLAGCGGSSHHASTPPRASDFRILTSPGGETHITQVSDDGTTILGSDENSNGPYLWTREGVASHIPDTVLTQATALTPDGKQILGYLNATSIGPSEGIVYTIGGDSQKLPLPDGVPVESPIDAGNSTILAHGPNASGVDQFFVIHDGKTTVLPQLAGNLPAYAGAISRKGFTVAGYSGNKPVRWTNLDNPTPQALTQTSGVGGGVSDDGSVIVGLVYLESGSMPFRWTQSKGLVLLPLPTGMTGGIANDVSGDGKVVIGNASYVVGATTMRRPFVWTASKGSRLLENVIDFGGTPFGGMTKVSVSSISADGHTVVGEGTIVEDGNPRIRGFVVTLP